MTRRLIAIFLLLLVSATASARESATAQKSWTAATVSMEVRKPSGTDSYTNVPWTLNMTVLDVMKSVAGIEFTAEWSRGFSDWLILSIDGVENKGTGKKNWTFCVNGFPAGVGVSAYRLGPGAKIVWVYGKTYPPKCK